MASTKKPIHILGIGNVGRLIAHSLAASKSAPAVLLMYRQEQVMTWEENGRRINLIKNGLSDNQDNFEHEKTFVSDHEDRTHIQNLIVATKTYTTIEALKPLRKRLTSGSNLLFLQNGMGTIDEVNSLIFPNPLTRPLCYTGIVTHGLYAHQNLFTTVLAGPGTIRIGPSSSQTPEPSAGNHLLSSLVSIPGLATTIVSSPQIMRIQLLKLGINATVNSLTAVLNRPNGFLLSSFPALKLIHQLISSEIAPVLNALAKRSSSDSEALAEFTPNNLEKVVLDATAQTAENVSSTLQDVRAGRKTEIRYINGYIITQGSQLGLECPMNRKLVRLIEDQTTVSEDEIEELFDLKG